MMKWFSKRIPTALVAPVVLVALLGGTASAHSRGPNADSRSRGPNVVAQGVTALDYQLVAQSTPCIIPNYPDGVHMATVCIEVNNTSGSTWSSGYAHLWNMPLSSGAHSGDFIYMCDYNTTTCSSQAGDNASRDNFNFYGGISDATTRWVTLHAHFNDGSPSTCVRVFANSAAAMSWVPVGC